MCNYYRTNQFSFQYLLIHIHPADVYIDAEKYSPNNECNGRTQGREAIHDALDKKKKIMEV